MIESFRHPGIVVKDMEAAIRFYCDYLGHEVIVDFIEKGNYFNKLIGLKDTEARVVKVNSPDGIYLELIEFINYPVTESLESSFASIGINHICYTVKGIDSLYKRLIDFGVEFISPPLASDFDPVKTCFCYGPDRVLVQFVEVTDLDSIRDGLK
jgi:catechol 2,3-dioxygenase-like lactoylglutathione lyase family enzyme